MPRKRLPRKRGPACTICSHVDRALIEASKLAGCGLDAVAAKYSISRFALWRHMKKHVSDDQRAEYLAQVPLKELATKAASEGLSVLEYLSLTRATLVRELQLAAIVHDRHAVVALGRALNENLSTIARLTGEMGTLAARNISVTNNISLLASDTYHDLRDAVMKALRPHPEAGRAVAEALVELEERELRPAPRMIDVSPSAQAAS